MKEQKKYTKNNGDYIVDGCCISLLKNKVIVKPEKNSQNFCANRKNRKFHISTGIDTKLIDGTRNHRNLIKELVRRSLRFRKAKT